jgi:hypothetical protein
LHCAVLQEGLNERILRLDEVTETQAKLIREHVDVFWIEAGEGWKAELGKFPVQKRSILMRFPD